MPKHTLIATILVFLFIDFAAKVKLTPNQRGQLLEIVHYGKRKAKTTMHAQILLQADSSAGGPGLRAETKMDMLLTGNLRLRTQESS